MLGSCTLQFVLVKIDQKDTVRERLGEEVTRCNTSDSACTSGDDDVLASRIDHL